MPSLWELRLPQYIQKKKIRNVRHHNHLWRHWDIIVTVDVIETSWSSLTSLKGTSKHIGMVWLTLLTAKLVRKLVDALRSVNHKGLHQGWETSFYLKKVLISQVIISQVMFFFFCLFIFRGHSTREPASGRLTDFSLRTYTCVSHSQHRKNRERFWKNAGEWTGRVEISKKEIPGSKRSMYGYILTYARL